MRIRGREIRVWEQEREGECDCDALRCLRARLVSSSTRLGELAGLWRSHAAAAAACVRCCLHGIVIPLSSHAWHASSSSSLANLSRR